MTIKAIIWDLGGVLVRTNDYTSRDALAARFGMSRAELEELVYGEDSGHSAQLGIIDVKQHWENVRKVLGLSFEEVDSFRNRFWSGDRLDSELVAFIRSLKNNYRTGLLSNAFSNLRQVIREIWKIEDVFDVIVISAEEGLIKPDPRIYKLALERLGVDPPDALFIDDMLENVESARVQGMNAVQFRTPDQALKEVYRHINEDQK